MSESKYAGKVGHGSVQEVKAPFRAGGKVTGGKVIHGEDLRTGKKS